jgi:hypothetical protein
VVGPLQHDSLQPVAIRIDKAVPIHEQVGSVVVPVGVATDGHRVLVGQYIRDPDAEGKGAEAKQLPAPTVG